MHGAETPDKKWRVRFHNSVIGPVPCDVFRLGVRRHFTKPHKSSHLVHVPPYCLLHDAETPYIVIDVIGQQVFLTVCKPPQDPIEEIPSLRIAKTGAYRSQAQEI